MRFIGAKNFLDTAARINITMSLSYFYPNGAKNQNWRKFSHSILENIREQAGSQGLLESFQLHGYTIEYHPQAKMKLKSL